MSYLESAALVVFPKLSFESVELVRPNVNVGLSIEFKEAMDLNYLVQSSYSISDLQSLRKLTHEFGFLRLKNAFVATGCYNAKISGDRMGGILDPFHRDDFVNNGSHDNMLSMLSKKVTYGRELPTYYALQDDVKKAINTLLQKSSSISDNARLVLQTMLEDNYNFAVTTNDHKIRECLQKEYPDFVQEVFNLIPNENTYSHKWNSGENFVLIHSNKRDRQLLHARPSSDNQQPNIVKLHFLGNEFSL